jgi:tRNA dimethylallyltransferase
MTLHSYAARGADAPQPLLIAIIGPTASGKTDLAMRLAQRLPSLLDIPGVEVVSADSRQIYRLMDIATAKPTAAERGHAPHHMLDIVWPDDSYTLAEYQRDAQATIAAIQARGALPLLVGGTGLYVRSVVDGLAIPSAEPQPALRAEWKLCLPLMAPPHWSSGCAQRTLNQPVHSTPPMSAASSAPSKFPR